MLRRIFLGLSLFISWFPLSYFSFQTSVRTIAFNAGWYDRCKQKFTCDWRFLQDTNGITRCVLPISINRMFLWHVIRDIFKVLDPYVMRIFASSALECIESFIDYFVTILPLDVSAMLLESIILRLFYL